MGRSEIAKRDNQKALLVLGQLKQKERGGEKRKKGGKKKQPQNRFLFFVAVSHAHILLVFITAMWHKLDLTIQQTTSFSKLFVLIT